ncbi:MAG: phosphoribosylformylglycinamidine synthase II [Gammaproteobacteria bacterium RIFCSPHIGHO2_12_FULL_41_20]|nr:MAG: phosphoribosylformylglycinamidine synthase II [Gammaproteobacteria bacterium RIFCSPHIGHO2_12_FULL_41_20]
MLATPEYLDFTDLSRDEVHSLLRRNSINLTIDEALTIQTTFLKRPPTLSECILWSIQGSEHCSYKSSRKYLQNFVTSGPQVILGPKEDAGIVSVATDHHGRRYGLVVSHESHNHPSQIVPYEGAATGVGGNVRDVCCMGAEVIAVADSLRFGDIAQPKTTWIHAGVVSGIAGYGNPLGVPNLAGDVYYDAGYNENCLVTVVTLGIVPEADIIHSYAPSNAQDYVFILVGKPTDNSGFGGASFASAELHADQHEQNKGAVQEPNAFLQRHLLKANYALFRQLKSQGQLQRVGFKDLGAGGVACASVELADAGGYGADINIDWVPTSMHDLHPAVILCSETQERFMWIVPPELVEMILHHYNEVFALPAVSTGARAAVVGKIRGDGIYRVTSHGQDIVHARASDITKGLLYDRPVVMASKFLTEPELPIPPDFNVVLLQLLAHENIASRAPLIEMYDKQVQGRTVIEAGMADAGVLQPFNEERYPEEIRQVGIALSLDQNPRYNKIDAYWGAVNAVVESVRNIAATGATPLALTDCLCFGNPEKPEQMGEFVASVRGIVDACAAITLQDFPAATLPIISGNVSLYNESQTGAIPPSPMICCVGQLPDVSKAVTKHLQQTGSLLVLVGARHAECGGSVYYQLFNQLGSQLPKPDLQHISQEIHAVVTAIQQGLVLSAHDISEGGIAVALAEMCFKNNVGFCVTIPGDLPVDKKLFSESGGFVLEVAREQWQRFQAVFRERHVPIFLLGQTQGDPLIQVRNQEDMATASSYLIDLPIIPAKQAWENGLWEKLL